MGGGGRGGVCLPHASERLLPAYPIPLTSADVHPLPISTSLAIRVQWRLPILVRASPGFVSECEIPWASGLFSEAAPPAKAAPAISERGRHAFGQASLRRTPAGFLVLLGRRLPAEFSTVLSLLRAFGRRRSGKRSTKATYVQSCFTAKWVVDASYKITTTVVN